MRCVSYSGEAGLEWPAIPKRYGQRLKTISNTRPVKVNLPDSETNSRSCKRATHKEHDPFSSPATAGSGIGVMSRNTGVFHTGPCYGYRFFGRWLSPDAG